MYFFWPWGVFAHMSKVWSALAAGHAAQAPQFCQVLDLLLGQSIHI